MSNPQKTPFARTITNKVQNEIADAGQLDHQSLPCRVIAVQPSGSVTVAFEIAGPIALPSVTIPQEISRYWRPPTQVGDKGVARAADAYLGGVSGLGGGVAQYMRKDANLSNLVFSPISNASFPTVDGNANVLTAPNGAVIKDDTGASVFTLTPTSITMSCGGHSIVISSAGVVIDGKAFLTHVHGGVSFGGSDTTGVV